MTEEHREQIALFQLISDVFFCKVLEDISACEEVIRIITGKDFQIKEVRSQYTVRQLLNHSVTLDIIAIDESNAIIHLEMHPQNNEDHMRRTRYNTACVDVETLKKSTEYRNIPDVYGIYISKKPFVKGKRGVNCIKRFFAHTKDEDKASNGIHEYYVNLDGVGETWEQAELLKYLVNADGVLEHEAFPNLVKRVRFLKEEQGGHEIMCEILDRERKIGEEIGKEIGASNNQIELIRKKVVRKLSASSIAEFLEEEVGYVEKIISLLRTYPNESNEEISRRIKG